jgi:predicted MFS family arabinose efflux permease
MLRPLRGGDLETALRSLGVTASSVYRTIGLAMTEPLTCLLWLTLGAFAIGTEGFMIAGLLPALAQDLNVGLPAAGHLVTAFSLAYALGAPVMAVLTAGLERRRLLALAMSGFVLANLLAALVPSYVGLLGARLLLALSAASFMPAASGYAAALGGPERRGRALAMVTTGLTLAIIAGVPLGVLVGEGFGWRATFLGVAGLAALSLLGILARLPRQQPGATASLGERLALAGRGDVLAVLATTTLAMAGAFRSTPISASSWPASPGLARRGWRWCCWASAWPAPPAPGSAAVWRTAGAGAAP